MPATPHDPEFEERARVFAEKVRHRRNQLGYTEMRLVELTGLSRGYIQLLMNNRGSHKDKDGNYKPPNPTLDVIWRISDALELPVDYLVDSDRPVEELPVRG